MTELERASHFDRGWLDVHIGESECTGHSSLGDVAEPSHSRLIWSSESLPLRQTSSRARLGSVCYRNADWRDRHANCYIPYMGWVVWAPPVGIKGTVEV